MTTFPNTSLLSLLSKSVLFRTYQEAFERATGLAIDLQEPDEHRSERPETLNSFCSLMRRAGSACEGCLRVQPQLFADSAIGSKTDKCHVGLCQTAVSVRVGENILGFLRTGKVLLEAPSRAKFLEISQALRRVDPDIDLRPFESAYFGLRVLTSEQYGAMIQLLSLFSDDLAGCYSQLMLQRTAVDASPILRAKAIMEDHFRGELTLKDISKRVGVSATHFSALFKKVTGLNFLEYLTRLRIEEAKNLLRNPNYRISETAFKSGFQSVSQFNRTFRYVCGMSPRAYRDALDSRNTPSWAIAASNPV